MRDKAKRETGFTVMELMVTMAITSVVAMVVTPQFSRMIYSFDRFNARTDLIQDLKRAQAESLTQGCRGIFKAAANGKSYSFGCDYLAYDVSNPPSSDTISFVRNLPSHLSISTASTIIFNSRGESVDTNFIISNNSVTLSSSESGSSVSFATGTLLGTGVFSFD